MQRHSLPDMIVPDLWSSLIKWLCERTPKIRDPHVIPYRQVLWCRQAFIHAQMGVPYSNVNREFRLTGLCACKLREKWLLWVNLRFQTKIVKYLQNLQFSMKEQFTKHEMDNSFFPNLYNLLLCSTPNNLQLSLNINSAKTEWSASSNERLNFP